uniref:Uncharacterized protein n=1 Tax=Panagrolaimus sp. ES5 TaxID=591445 RepID=A0AC34FU12_9BILA
MEIDEKYAMILSSPNGINVVPLEPIKVKKSFEKEDKLPKSKTVIFNDSMTLVETNLMKDKKLFDSIFSKTVICFPRILRIQESKLSAEMVLKFLSKYTKEFSLSDSSCNPNLAFSDIIKKAPNLQEFHIYDFETNLIFEKTWVEDLLKYKNGKNFVNLSIKLDILELNIESMVEFIQTKCSKDIYINIILDQKLEGDDDEDGNDEDIYEAAWEKFEAIKDELSKYFNSDAEEDETCEKARMEIGFDGGDSDGVGVYSLRKIKKPKRIMPTRAATARKYV